MHEMSWLVELERIALVTGVRQSDSGYQFDACLRDMSSYKGRTVDAQAVRGDEGRGQLRKASVSR